MRFAASVPLLALAGLSLLDSSCDNSTEPPPSRAPSAATFVPMVSLRGYLSSGEPWSPDGARLAYYDAASDSIAVLDALTPRSSPLKVVASWATAIRWSPDGGWLLLRRSDGRPTFASRLIVARVPRAGRPGLVVEITEPSPDIGQAVWASDGNISWWNMRTGKRTTVSPPPEWKSENPSSFPERTHLLPRIDPHTGMLAPLVFETVPVVVETPIDVQADSTAGHILVLDFVPGGQQLLLSIPDAPCSFTAAVDRGGTILSRYWTPCANALPGGPFTYKEGSVRFRRHEIRARPPDCRGWACGLFVTVDPG